MKKRKSKTPAVQTLDALTPSSSLLSKIGSMIVHADEAFSPDGRQIDRNEFYNLYNQADVQEWIKAMGPLLPLKREGR